MAAPRSLRRVVLRAAGLLLVNVLLVVATLALLEGLSSFWLAARVLGAAPADSVRIYTEYDPDLGWINQAAVDRADAFGPGVGVRTNRQRFRASHEVPPELPAGRLRMVAAGDSFTFGNGVTNSEVWVELLGQEPWLETVNLAQSGYGFDQAYLRYRRDGDLVRHDVAVLAFITHDFKRMSMDRFAGLDKPYLELDTTGKLVVRNTPVPRQADWRRLTRPLAAELQHLRSFALAREWLGTGASEAADETPAESVDVDAIHLVPDLTDSTRVEALIAAVVADFAEIARRRGALPLLIQLPSPHDSRKATWRDAVRTAAEGSSVVFLDLIEDINVLSRAERTSLCHRTGPADIRDHYNSRGNAWVAELVRGRLLQLQRLRRRATQRQVELPLEDVAAK